MRLERLDLTRYGRFTDARLHFPAPVPGAPDLHVIFGPNEAGKSTLFSGWLDLLYGVPMRTRYDFLHPGPTMQIGAQLSHGGGILQAVRIKRNGPSLQDANGQTLPEAAMQAALSGLSREGYAAMFSLDDDTLEQGGESILASRGDLGEMLFSASAGLAGLGPQLETIRRETDAFHKSRARNTTLKAAKDRLADLDRQRRDLDVTASAAQKLQRDVQAAEKAWRLAGQAEAETDAALKRVNTALAVVPQQARLARLRDELAPMAHLPEATETDERDLNELEQALRGLAGQMATRAEAIAELELRAAAIARDPVILPLADAIAQAQGLHPLHLAALNDLPRRQDSLSAITADVSRRMLVLGLSGAASGHVVTPAGLARLRSLLARRDLAMQAVDLAKAEVEQAAGRVQSAQIAVGDGGVGDLLSLSHLVAHMRQRDPETARGRAIQDLALREADLVQALHGLAPWRGSAEALAALDAPAAWRVTEWEATDQDSARALRLAGDARDRCMAALAAARQSQPVAGSGTVTLADAVEARRLREAAWALHLAEMTSETATRFEAALRLDDRVSLQLAQAMADETRAAQDALTLARLTAEAEKAQSDWQICHEARQGFELDIAAAAATLGLEGAGLADLRAWLAARDKALVAKGVRDAAQAALERAQTATAADCADLAAALALPEDWGFARLMAEALTRLDRSSQAQEAAKHLAAMQADLATRKADHAMAMQRLQAWQQDWKMAANGTPLAALPDGDAGLAQVLDDLDHLSRLEAERADLADRVAKMAANMRSFQNAVAGVVAALALPDGTPWEGLPERLAQAQQAERAHQQISADMARSHAAQAADQARTDVLIARRDALAKRLSWPGEGRLTDHLAACLQASRLRRAIAELDAELSSQAVQDQDATMLEAEVLRLTEALTLVRSEREARFADYTEAQRALQAVGGDDAVARLAAERANLLNELRDQTRTHLAQRFGLMAFEQALRRYRDSHRSAMLARASDAFRQLSRGAYTGLAAQPEGGSEVLVAVPAKGGAKLATDLSKGTRFQLYLALRIAGYHELARSRPPVPFIADDIMETFDDGRAEQAFALLADMARCGQVIYLTHHQHLCDMALRVCPSARITRLHEV